jgi:hypothetical protein
MIILIIVAPDLNQQIENYRREYLSFYYLLKFVGSFSYPIVKAIYQTKASFIAVIALNLL